MGTQAPRHRLVLLSGGLDSAAMLYLSPVDWTKAMFIDYGQVSAKLEERAARALTAEREITLEVVRVGDLARLGAGTLARATAISFADGETQSQREEWFPGRNLMLSAIGAISLARAGGGELAFGALSDSYRDARPTFFESVEKVIDASLPSDIRIKLIVPSASRLEVLREAYAAGLEPRLSFSCNRRDDRHCWRCTSCQDRSQLIAALLPQDSRSHP